MESSLKMRRKRGPPTGEWSVQDAPVARQRPRRTATGRQARVHSQHLKSVALAARNIATGRSKRASLVSALLSVQWLILYGDESKEVHDGVNKKGTMLAINRSFLEHGWTIAQAGLQQGEYQLSDNQRNKAKSNLADWRAQLVEPWIWRTFMGAEYETSPKTLTALCLAVLNQLEIARVE
ncbi:hypothetical protein [Aeromonas veronii]|uniref:hypothetical protein n=1 Tax=Aeromonas veronii TaxID=654 RepID=UPI003BA37011